MPGTVGSAIAALPLLWLIGQPNWAVWLLLGSALFTAMCVYLARIAKFDRTQGDPGWFVLDEAAGMWLAALGCLSGQPIQVGLAFLAFRVFDIAKPWPIRALEKVPYGFGIVLDDLLAGGYAVVAVALLNRFLLT
jgi:phosphatidylglycerophosphatase A